MSGVQSIERAFSILRCLSGGPAGVTELADRVSLPKSTVSRLLSTLEQLSVVEQVSNGGPYRLGSQMFEIAAAATPSRSLRDAALPHLFELTRATGEASGLAIVEQRSVLYLDQVDSAHAVQVRDWTGDRIPMHLVSSGLVLLAFAEPVIRAAYLDHPLQAATVKSVVDPAQIRRRLDDIHRSGWCWVVDEYEEGISSVAAPIRDRGGAVVAAVHAHGPSYRFPGRHKQGDVAALVVTAARRIEDNLGWED